MTGRNSVTSILLIVLGALWIFLTGACCDAMFKGMREADKLPLVLLCTLPGCVLVLAGLVLRLSRSTAGLIVLAYAAILSFVWTSAALAGVHGPLQDKLVPLAIFNTPPAALLIWGLVLVLKRSDGPAA